MERKENNIMAQQITFTPNVAFHPGITLDEKLKEMSMSIKEFAVRTSKPEKTIHAVINGESSITSDMAVAFETVTKIPANFWMNKQRSYDEFKVRKQKEEEYKSYLPWLSKFPLAEISNLGWLDKALTPASRSVEGISQLFRFFGVTSPKAWERFYLNQELKVSFSLSLAEYQNPYALSCWLRKGEIEAAKLYEISDFDEKKIPGLIEKIAEYYIEMPPNWYEDMQKDFLAVGIKLITVQTLTGMSVDGCVRWMDQHPCIQLAHNIKYDEYWHSLFHELGHVYLHGKKLIFIEDKETVIYQKAEEEAERFANRYIMRTKTPR